MNSRPERTNREALSPMNPGLNVVRLHELEMGVNLDAECDPAVYEEFSDIAKSTYYVADMVSSPDRLQAPSLDRLQLTQPLRREYAQKAAIARQFIRYGETMPAPSSIEDLQRKLYVATEPVAVERAMGDAQKLDAGAVMRRIHRNLLCQFIEYNPDDAPEAFRFWEKRTAALGQADILHTDFNTPFKLLTNRAGRNRDNIVDTPVPFQEPYYIEQIDRYLERQFTFSFSELLASLKHRRFDSVAEITQTLDAFDNLLSEKTPMGSGKVMQHGADIFLNSLHYSSQFSTSSAKMLTLFKQQQEKGVLGLSTYLRLSNALTPNLTQRTGESLELLNEKSLSDLPKAFDRLSRYARENIDEESVGVEMLEAAVRFGNVASLVASIGVERKMQQGVLTIGDLAVRYPKASAQELSTIADHLEAGESQTAAHGLYREIRHNRRRDHHVRRRAHKPGYGVIS